MKIKKLNIPIEFQPIEVTIVLDTKEKFDYFLNIVSTNVSIPSLINNNYNSHASTELHKDVFGSHRPLEESQK